MKTPYLYYVPKLKNVITTTATNTTTRTTTTTATTTSITAATTATITQSHGEVLGGIPYKKQVSIKSQR